MSRGSSVVRSLLAVLFVVVLLFLPISAVADGGICNKVEVVRTRHGTESKILLYENGTWYGEGSDNKVVYVDSGTSFNVILWRSGGGPTWIFRLIGPGWDSGDQESTGSFRYFSPPSWPPGTYFGRVDTDPWKRFDILVDPNQAPYQPSSPSPSDGATDISIYTDLSWSGGDPDGDSVTYDVYFEKDDSSPNQLVSNDQSGTSYDPGTLDYSSHYYWQIEAKDEHGATRLGPVWDFTTSSPEPGDVSVATYSATGIGETQTTLQGAITSFNNNPSAEIRFGYRVQGTTTWSYTGWVTRTTTATYSETVSGLSTDTTYEFRAEGRGSVDTTIVTGGILTFTTSGEPNQAPYQPRDASPADGATDITVHINPSWNGGDPDGDSVTYDVYFEKDDSTPDQLVSDDQSAISYDPGTLEYNSHYYWQIEAKDEHGATTSGPVWDFTTSGEPNQPPYQPSSPSPSDGATDISIYADLSWIGGDPDPDSVTYDVYFEKDDSSPDQLMSDDQSGTSYDPGTLDYSSHYYWLIVARDEHGATTSGSVWDFTTSEDTNQPPYEPYNPSPPNHDTMIWIHTDLSWSGGDPDGDTVTYDVYLEKDDSSPDPLVSHDQSGTRYFYGNLDYNSHYYWQIVAKDQNGATTPGPVWDFTTSEDPDDPLSYPKVHGYSFANRGRTPSWEMYQNTFGREETNYSLTGLPKPSAAAYYLIYKRFIDPGLCDGMCATSRLFYQGSSDVTRFNSDASKVYDLKESEDLWKFIERYQGYQLGKEIIGYRASQDTSPTSIFEDIKQSLESGNANPRALIIHGLTQGDFRAHALVPYMIAKDGDGDTAHVYVYDPNLYGDTNCHVTFALDDDSWAYNRKPWASTWLWSTPLSLYKLEPTLPTVTSLSSDIIAFLAGEADMFITDSQGRSLGFHEGGFVAEIPNAVPLLPTVQSVDGGPQAYYLAQDSHHYEASGTSEGTYEMSVILVDDDKAGTFSATDIPTSAGAVHEYTIDWDALSEGEEGVTIQLDTDGDGVFEYTFASDQELTRDEFMQQSSWCFIATAAYGTPMSRQIRILREFRDEYLLTNPLGLALVSLYYKVSPPIGDFITEHPRLKPIVRAALVPTVAMSAVVVNSTPAEKVAIVGSLVLISVVVAMYVTRRRGRGPEYT